MVLSVLYDMLYFVLPLLWNKDRKPGFYAHNFTSISEKKAQSVHMLYFCLQQAALTSLFKDVSPISSAAAS